MNVILCPVCRSPIIVQGSSFKCANGHSFDIAKEGYVNLISGAHKPGSSIGDSRSMAVSRREFLDKGYFAPLKNAVSSYIAQYASSGPALDICCGEGYYTSALKGESRDIYAFDLSKEMVRLAAKRKEAFCFVANIASIPVSDGAFSAAMHLFAPFHDREFSRIMSSDGILLTAVPGREHLMGMKKVLYEKPYENDEAPPQAPSFDIADTLRVRADILLCREDIAALFNMTPYGVRSPREGTERLLSLQELETTIEFVIYVLKKK